MKSVDIKACWTGLGSLLLLLLPSSFAEIDEECSRPSESINCTSYVVTDQRWIQSNPVLCVASCEQWIIKAEEDEVVTLSFEYLDIPDPDPLLCRDSYLLIGPDNCRRLCGVFTNGTAISYIGGDEVRILYRQSAVFGLGFKLRYTIGKIPSAEPCLNNEFRCANGKCIPSSWHCNNASECEDNSDEVCYDVAVPSSTVSPPLDYSCGIGGFCCVDSIYHQRHCFADTNRCNGINDCLDGQDERDCVCRATMSGKFGNISYPSGSLYGATCEFLITIPNGTIQLRFPNFNFTSSDDEYLEIYSGGIADAARLKYRFTGKNKPSRAVDFDANVNQIYMKYVRSNLGSYSAFSLTYQQKGVCLPGQLSCSNEDDCYDPTSICDDIWDCKQYGTDELNCGICKNKSYRCRVGSTCYEFSKRCNGVPDCNNYVDELQCTSIQCGHHNGTYLCLSGQCIQERHVCDGYYNCKDNSDEINCPLPSKIVIAAIIGSLCCGLLLVIAAASVCRLHAVRSLMTSRSYHVSPITAIQEELLARLSAPPLYDEAMLTSRPYEEVRNEILRRMRPDSTQDPEAGSLPPPPPPLTDGRRWSGILVPGSSDAPVLAQSQAEDDDDDLLVDVGVDSNPVVSASDSDLDCDAFDDSLVDLSLATGLHAQWRRGQSGENALPDIDERFGDLCLVDICDTEPLISSNNETPGDAEPKQTDAGRSNINALLKGNT